MENQVLEFKEMLRHEVEVIFTSSALTGLLSANGDLSRHPNDLAKAAIAIGRATANHLVPEEQAEPTVN